MGLGTHEGDVAPLTMMHFDEVGVSSMEVFLKEKAPITFSLSDLDVMNSEMADSPITSSRLTC